MNKDRNDDFFDNGVNTFTLTDDEGNEYEFSFWILWIWKKSFTQF